VACIEPPHSIYDAHYTAGFRCIHEPSWCESLQHVLGSPWERTAIWRKWQHRHWEESKTSKRRQCWNQYGVGHETRFSKHNWESTYFMIMWKSWNWPSNSSECLLYWLHWHLVIETSSLTLKESKSASRNFQLWMWGHIWTLHWSCSNMSTTYMDSPASGSEIQNTVITGHSLQHKMNRPLSSMSCNYSDNSEIGPCGCWRGLQSHCITISQCTMTCMIISIAWCELWLKRRPHGRKTCSSPWS